MLAAQANAEAAGNSSQAKLKEAQAEKENAQKVAAKRDFAEKLEKTFSEATVARKSQIVVSGKNAEGILDYYSEASRLHS